VFGLPVPVDTWGHKVCTFEARGLDEDAGIWGLGQGGGLFREFRCPSQVLA
jgi:hypothetical protein